MDTQLKGGIAALVVNGTTGEPTTMTHRERTAFQLPLLIRQVNKKIPVIVGASGNNTLYSP